MCILEEMVGVCQAFNLGGVLGEILQMAEFLSRPLKNLNIQKRGSRIITEVNSGTILLDKRMVGASSCVGHSCMTPELSELLAAFKMKIHFYNAFAKFLNIIYDFKI